MTEPTEVPTIVIVSTAIIFGLVGFAAIFWTDRLVDLSLRINRGWMGTLNPFRPFLGTQSHREAIRITGVLAAVVSGIALLELAIRLFRD